MSPANRCFKAAVFVDAENQTHLSYDNLMQDLAYLQLVEKHAFADWRDQRLEGIADELHRHKFDLHHIPSGETVGAEKDKSDRQMANHIKCVLSRRHDIGVVVLITGDHYFSQIAQDLRQKGIQVIVVASPMSVSKKLCSVAQQYLPIGEMASWIKALDDLERRNRCLIDSRALRKSGIPSHALRWLVDKGLVDQRYQENASESMRGFSLNRRAHPVRMVLKGATTYQVSAG